MKSLKLVAGLACLCALLVFPVAPAGAAVSAPVPLDSWVYPALDKLAGLGLIDTALQGARPYSRLEALRQLQEARDRAADANVPAVAGELLLRLEVEFASELAWKGNRQGLQFKPLRELRLDYFYQDGQDSVFPGTDGRQFALDPGNSGIDYARGHNGQLLFESEARFGRHFLVNIRPLLRYGEGEGDAIDLLHGVAAVGLGPIELSAGRQSLWWGQGRRGTLVLTDNAKPLDMLRLTNPEPATLPWILRYLGPTRFDLFVSRLEDDRVVPEPYFGGLRLIIKPATWLELGASRTVIFGGEGRPSVDFDDFLTILGGENVGGSSESNQLAAIDFRLKLQPLWGAELYGEMGGEDQADLLGVIPFFSKKAILAGLYLPQIEPTGRLSLRLEYLDTDYEGNGPVWYRHGVYQSGYVYEGMLLGHPAGGDASSLFIELQALLPRDVTVTAGVDLQQRGESQPVHEEHRMPFLDVEWAVTAGLALHAGYSFDRVENFGFVAGDDRTLHFGRAGVRWNW